jgi:hypothetical protein
VSIRCGDISIVKSVPLANPKIIKMEKIPDELTVEEKAR